MTGNNIDPREENMIVLLTKTKIGWEFRNVHMDGNARVLDYALEEKHQMMGGVLVIHFVQNWDH